MNSSFFQLTLENVPEAQEELVSSLCFDWQASGVAQDLAFHQTQFEYKPEIVPSLFVRLNVYFEAYPGEDFFADLRARFPEIEFAVTEEQNKDWLAEWKKSFQPFRLAGPFWVVPSWCEAPPQAQIPVWMDPGMAFGTGTHATTQMAASLLVETLKPGYSFLDVGTGTGILAILAQHLQASEITATDNDPQALSVAAENFAKNNSSHIQLYGANLADVPGPFDFVTANIVDGVLLQLKPELLRLKHPTRGRLILSGILLEREDLFVKEFLEGTGLTVVKRLEQDEWVGLLLK